MKTERLQTWALAAEIIGGIAVVVTLIFLVLETRENTNAIQTQTYQSLTSELNIVRRTMATPVMADMMVTLATSGLDALSENEQFIYVMSTGAKWGVYESAFYAHERGVLGESEWLRFMAAICRNYALDHVVWAPEEYGKELTLGGISYSMATGLTPEFTQYTEASCDAGTAQLSDEKN